MVFKKGLVVESGMLSVESLVVTGWSTFLFLCFASSGTGLLGRHG